MKRLTKMLSFLFVVALLVSTVSITAFAAPVNLDTINIKNFVEPALGSTIADATPTLSNAEFFDSSSSPITDGISLTSVSWLYVSDTAIDQVPNPTDVIEKKVYALTLNFTYDNTKVKVPIDVNKYDGNFKTNNEDTNFYDSDVDVGYDTIEITLVYDYRITVDIEDVNYYWYPIVGTKVKDNPLTVSVGIEPQNMCTVEKYNAGTDDWKKMKPNDIFEEGGRYRLSNNVSMNLTAKYTARNKWSNPELTLKGFLEVSTNFNNKKITDVPNSIAAYCDDKYPYIFDYINYEIDSLKSSFNVTYNANGHGTAPEKEVVIPGTKATKPSDLKADGYVFGGWYTDKECTTAYDFSKGVYDDITLYAKWTAVETKEEVANTVEEVANTADNNSIIRIAALGAVSVLGIVSIKKKEID